MENRPPNLKISEAGPIMTFLQQSVSFTGEFGQTGQRSCGAQEDTVNSGPPLRSQLNSKPLRPSDGIVSLIMRFLYLELEFTDG